MATSAPRQAAAPAHVQTVGETFKNIQVLTDMKDAPASDLYSTMQFMAGSLSVSCEYCHASQRGPFDSDVKRTKRTARDMIRMTRAINSESFGGRQVVTCNTCHRGSPHPQGVPMPWHKTPSDIDAYRAEVADAAAAGGAALDRGASAAGGTPSGLSRVDDIFARYRRAVGADRLKSLRLVGTTAAVMSGQNAPVPFEVDFVFPDRILIRQGPPGAAVENIVNGDRGWHRAHGSTSPLTPAQIAAIHARIEPLLPVKYAAPDAARHLVGTDTVGSTRVYVMQSQSTSPREWLYFDMQSGLLTQSRRDTPTVLGTRVEETTFDDYRRVDAVTLSYRITNHYMEDQSVWLISRAERNAAIDPKTFDAGGM